MNRLKRQLQESVNQVGICKEEVRKLQARIEQMTRN